MKSFDVAVVGATGMVGRTMMKVLEERKFPVSRLLPLASERSVGKQITFKGMMIDVRKLEPEQFRGIHFALFSAGAGVSREFAPHAVKAGAIVIDNSSAFRMDEGVPLVVPEVNRHQAFNHKGIIANPNCSTIQMVVVLKPLHDRFKIKRVVVSTYQSVTGAGQRAVAQLEDELANRPVREMKFPHPIAFNCLPHIDVFFDDGYTKEEMKMKLETRKIMEANINVTATTVRVPVMGGHSESVNIEFENECSVHDVREILRTAPGVVLQDDPAQNLYPMPVTAFDKDEVFVGRIRKDDTIPHGINLWIVSDNIRKGAATNAVQIAEALIAGS
jgi:aspartate-semialdehyde dehydrogenase